MSDGKGPQPDTCEREALLDIAVIGEGQRGRPDPAGPSRAADHFRADGQPLYRQRHDCGAVKGERRAASSRFPLDRSESQDRSPE